MSKHLIYLDQSIISLQAKEGASLKTSTDIVFVYSKEHFREIQRAKHRAHYLDVLEKLDARLLELVFDEQLRLTDQIVLRPSRPPQEHFDEFSDAMSEVHFNESIFDPFMAWVNGGEVLEDLQRMPGILKDKIEEILRQNLNGDALGIEDIKTSQAALAGVIEQISREDNNILKIRELLGVPRSGLSGIEGDGQLEQIWNIISANVPESSSDEFFGFSSIDPNGKSPTNLYLSIVGCCAKLDLLGFHAEPKGHKLLGVRNVQSDAAHLAMGAYCSILLTTDKRMAKRGNAIYEHLGIAAYASVL